MNPTSAPLGHRDADSQGAPAASRSTSAEVLSRLCELPPFQGVAIRVMQVSSLEDVDFRKLAGLLGSDPAFSAALLRIANSALFSLRSPVETVLQAATLVGIETLKSMAVTVAARSYFGDTLTRAHVRRCWTHSIASAMLAQSLASDWDMPADRAYTAAMLHDIGRLALLRAYPSTYEPLLERRFHRIGDSLLEETAVAGMTHCAAAGALMRVWCFPGDVVLAAESHHSAACCAGVPGLVRACCLCADFLGYSELGCRHRIGRDELVSALPASRAQRMAARLELLEDSVRQRLASLAFD